ncbi:MAG: HAMP domain-containing histidine kinase [Proteobacteria bacterium]|nr:HAMP domain-containing histidine kinase [Pseudomonadota bacterium]
MAPADRRQIRLEESEADLARVRRARDAALPAPPKRTSSLSARLLILTIAFVMFAQAAVLAPMMSRARIAYLNQKLEQAHLVLVALEVATREIDPLLRDTLLFQSGMFGMTIFRPGQAPRTLGPSIPTVLPHVYDLRGENYWESIFNAFSMMARSGEVPVAVTGYSLRDPQVLVEVYLDESPLRTQMYNYGRRILFIGFIVSVIAAAAVYVSLQWLAVHPLRRLTEAITSFQQAPEDPARIIEPSDRRDEVGVAEKALAAMQRELRQALLEKERLAGVGTAVTKISHDLRNILATATLELDGLEAAPDPEVRRMTASMMKAVDRAVQLSTTTMSFAKQGLPDVHKRTLNSTAFLQDVARGLKKVCNGCELRVTGEDVVFPADPELLMRVADNLVRNAAQAGATVVTLESDREADQAVIRVADNGPGLPKRTLENLFVPFAGSTRTGGAGLGLPIARELIRVQGGDLELASTSSAGTTFVIRLPL